MGLLRRSGLGPQAAGALSPEVLLWLVLDPAESVAVSGGPVSAGALENEPVGSERAASVVRLPRIRGGIRFAIAACGPVEERGCGRVGFRSYRMRLSRALN